MTARASNILIAAVIFALATASVVLFSHPEHDAQRITASVCEPARPAQGCEAPAPPADPPAALPDLGPLVSYLDTINTDNYLAELDAFLQAIAPPPVVVVPRPSSGTSSVVGGGGPLTDEQLRALALCESGTVDDGVNTGGWRTGLYGIEDPRAGQMSPAEQRAYAQRIYAQHGASAWGCPIR